MRTNIEIDDELLRDAMEATGQTTKRAVVEEALRRVVRYHRQKRALDDLKGIGWEGDLDAMRRDWMDWAARQQREVIVADSSVWIAHFCGEDTETTRKLYYVGLE
jgi:Arc/MetJ family transcription regulator